MAREVKYVVVQTEAGEEQLFTFPKAINHDAFAEVLSYIKEGGRNWKREHRKPVSAGFTDGKSCYGYSETLGLPFRKTDSGLLPSASVDLAAAQEEVARLRAALERIADPRNTHFSSDARVVAREALNK